MHFKSTEENRKVLLIRAPSAIAALLVARSEVFEVVIFVLAHCIVPSGKCHVVVIIVVLEDLSGVIFARQACRCGRFLVLNAYIILWNSSANLHFHVHGLCYGTCESSPNLCQPAGASAMCRPLPLKLGLWDNAMRAVVSSWILVHQALPIFAL
jgi:hypothetical protein